MRYFIKIFIVLIVVLVFSCERNSPNSTEDIITIDISKINRSVLIIGIDGFRSDAMQQSITPFIYQLTEEKNIYYNPSHIVEGITYSGPNWSSILTGVHMNKHNVTNNDYDNDNFADFPPFFHYIEKGHSSTNTSSIVNWTPINSYTLSSYVDNYNLEAMNDSTVFATAQDLLINSTEPAVVFLQFDELDVAGHSHGFSPDAQEYISTANTIDTYAQGLFNIIEDKRLNGEDWLYIIVSDHGGEGMSHGNANDPNINTTIFLTEHPSLEFRPDCCYISSQVDMAATIMNFLGITSSQFESNKDGNTVLVE